MQPHIKFCGAARTVTGSRHLFTIEGKRILVDCGLFQGSSELKQRNWAQFPVSPSEIDAVVLTHAHQDHIGYLPKLVREGYRGPIYCTRATADLCRISLPDSGRLQEEDARHRNKYNLSQHKPALPLYTESDAFASLKLLEKVPYETFHQLPGGAQWRYFPAGHILGSAFVELYFPNGERILMSGDLGRYDTPILIDPTTIEFAEYLVVESTYGDRLHSTENTEDHLERIIRDAVERGGAILVPSFAIGRTQELLYHLKKLQTADRLPRIPIFVDSPMASSTTQVYENAAEERDEEAKIAFDHHEDPLEPEGLIYIRDREQSKALNSQSGPLIVIAGSGMANGGRIVHHLVHRIGNPATTVLFTGYQAEGTLGRRILEKNPVVHILGQEVRVAARIEKLNALSAHADQGEIIRWLKGFKSPPKRTFIVHGEPPAQEALREKIVQEFGWNVAIPEHLQEFALE